MKRNKLLLTILTFSLTLLLSVSSYAQFGQLGQVLSAGTDDAEKIFEAYLSPYANGIGASLSTGWYNTAKAHKIGGFDISVSFNLAIIPTAGKSYNAEDLNLGDPSNGLNVAIDGANSSTAAGSNDPGQQLTYNQDILDAPVLIAQFNLPKGTGFGYTPAPMIQLGVGLVKETDLQFRYSPDIEWGNGSKIGLWGIGLKHSIKQWIPAINKLPLFDLSVQGGYTKLKSTSALNVQPSFYDNITDAGDIVQDLPGFYDNQELLLDVSNITANVIFSGDFKIICIYGGVGISSSSAILQLNGNYPYPEFVDITSSTQIIIDETTALVDPIDIKIESSDGSVTKPRFNAGFRLKFAVVTLNFDYTYANYSVASAGLGISFR
ncbi:MAG: hypothetical protein PF485_02985 [Bacteroidales bacterium]|jgi:hypothetical protein|nr:hypothetical protein [Bacteroidales bacterium]